MTHGFEGRLIARLKGVCRHCERAVVARAPKVEGQGGASLWVRCGHCETPVPARWEPSGEQGGETA